MTTLYLIEKGRRIGKITVEGKEVKVYPIKRVLKPWVIKCLAVLKPVAISLATILVGLLIAWAIVTAHKSSEEMYRACDEAKGYTCSYYEARNFSIRGE